ncbi:MAG: hypothetical protein FWB90_03970 [Fibromonadales bacterium]|nr:hypothetical protein [Fibromonadales bacterium]
MSIFSKKSKIEVAQPIAPVDYKGDCPIARANSNIHEEIKVLRNYLKEEFSQLRLGGLTEEFEKLREKLKEQNSNLDEIEGKCPCTTDKTRDIRRRLVLNVRLGCICSDSCKYPRACDCAKSYEWQII